jgi:peptide/nickel transport system substrate-binding protein
MFLNYSNRLRSVIVIIFAGLIVLIGGCTDNDKKTKSQGVSNSGTSAFETKYPRRQSLYIGGFQWGPPSSFNPLAISPAWPITGNVNLIYEAMFGYDLLDGSLKGIIGESYSFEGKLLKIHLHSEARWQNGDSLTSDDVVYTFQLHKNYPTNSSYLWNYVVNVKAAGPHDVIIVLNEKVQNPLVVKDVIANLLILPSKVFKKFEDEAFEQIAQETGAAPANRDVIEKIRELKNDSKPIGSGPYALESYSDEAIVLKRVDNYWGNRFYGGKEPGPLFIVHSSYPTNDKFNTALQIGDLDVSQTFFPQIWDKFDSGVGTWYDKEPYYIPGAIPALLMGLTRAPFNDVNFRKAVAYCINYEQIRTLAVYGYSPVLRPGLILPFGPEMQFFSGEDSAAYGTMYDPEKSKEILKKAGYTWGADAMLIDPKGKKVRTLMATCPKGWSDWETTIKIAVTGMRSVGIDVQEKFVDFSSYDNDLKKGLFDFTMKTPQSEQTVSLPWSRFEKVMTSKEYRPVGEVIYRNEGRFKSSKADKLLAAIPGESDPIKLKKLYTELNNLFLDEMPVIPLMYRPWLFYQFNTKYWTNFPTEKNPYAAPQCLMVGAGVKALWGIVQQKE